MMNRIKDKFFIIGEDDFHTQLIKEKYGDKWDSSYNNYFGHIVYIDTDPRQVVIASALTDLDVSRDPTSFSDYLQRLNSTDFTGILMLATIYHRRRDMLYKMVEPEKTRNWQLDTLLKDTHGWLLYNYQLENLILMGTGCNSSDAQTFRKRINRKEASAFYEAEGISIFGITLKDIIAERAENNPTLYPEYRGAYLLYKHLYN